jgi:hypothetical protein
MSLVFFWKNRSKICFFVFEIMSWSEGAAELVGTLRRKKEDHGMFEDPWKRKVFCWLSGNMLNMRNASDQSGQESFELGKWDVIVREKGKFILKRVQGDYQVQLKAESPAEADLWVQKLTAATATAKKLSEASDRAQQEEVARMQENAERLEKEKISAERIDRQNRERQAAEQAEIERAEQERMLSEQKRQAQLIAELANRQAIERAQLAEIARLNAEREAAERAQQAEMARQNAEREAERAHQAELARVNAEREAAERAQQAELARLNEEREAAERAQQADEARANAERQAAALAQQAEEARMLMEREAAEAAERLRKADMARLNAQQEASNNPNLLEKEHAARAQQDQTGRTDTNQSVEILTIAGQCADQRHPQVQQILVPRVQQGNRAIFSSGEPFVPSPSPNVVTGNATSFQVGVTLRLFLFGEL